MIISTSQSHRNWDCESVAACQGHFSVKYCSDSKYVEGDFLASSHTVVHGLSDISGWCIVCCHLSTEHFLQNNLRTNSYENTICLGELA